MIKGFSLLFTVLIISIILSLSLGIGSIVLNQIKLSGTGRESQIAFYAADAGIECALYWEIQESAFATTTTSSINCVEQNFTVGGGIKDKCNFQSQSEFTLNFENGSCTNVCVTKDWDAVNNVELTTIESLSSNQCPATIRSVQRGIRVTF